MDDEPHLIDQPTLEERCGELGAGNLELAVELAERRNLVVDIAAHEALFAEASVVLLQLEVPVETVEAAARLGRGHMAGRE